MLNAKPQVEYIISNIGPSLYRVSKFEGGEQPKDQYDVDMSKKNKPCKCLAWKSGKTRPCKHGAMVQAFIDAGEPNDFVILGQGKEWAVAQRVWPRPADELPNGDFYEGDSPDY